MPVEAATNCWTRAEDALAIALPQLAEFRKFTDETTAEASAKHVYTEETDEPIDGHADDRAAREPLGSIAVVTSDQQQPYRVTYGPDGCWYGSGRLLLVLERMVREREWRAEEAENVSRGQVYRWTKNRVGTLIDQLTEYWLQNGGPHVRDVTVLGPLENDPKTWDQYGRWQLCEVLIDWGLLTEN
jgi:hypothetical protein